MKKARDQYQVWVDDALKVRAIGCIWNWVIWLVVALLLLGFFVYNLYLRMH